MTSVSKNAYTDKLNDIVDNYNNRYHSSIKMKPVDVKSSPFIDFNEEKNKKEPEFEVGDHVRISRYQNIFAKCYIPNWSEEISVIKEVKNTVLWTYVIKELNEKEIVRTFYEKELQKTNQAEIRVAKLVERKDDKLYVK